MAWFEAHSEWVGLPSGVVFDGVNIWVSNRFNNTVTELRASDGSNRGTVSVGGQPIGITFDGADVWVTNSGSNTASKL
jgi:DNA-binding beta-propeller fold protein YncE